MYNIWTSFSLSKKSENGAMQYCKTLFKDNTLINEKIFHVDVVQLA